MNGIQNMVCLIFAMDGTLCLCGHLLPGVEELLNDLDEGSG